MKHRVRQTLLVIAAISVTAALLPVGPAGASPGLVTQQAAANDLADAVAGEGVEVSNATFTGSAAAGGTFGGGADIIGFENGIILSTGDIADVVGPNEVDNVTTQHGTAGDADLSALVGGATTFDAAVLEFDFVADADAISFQYVFSSDEYNEFVGSQFDDVFGFFVNGVNCATVNGSAVSVNTINLNVNSDLYRNNALDAGAPIDTEMDGLTVVLACEAEVNAGETNTMKLAIADVNDQQFDSNVFIQAGSLSIPDSTTTVELDPDNPTTATAFSDGVLAQFTYPAAGITGDMTIEVRHEDKVRCLIFKCAVWNSQSVFSTFPSLIGTGQFAFAEITVEGAASQFQTNAQLKDLRLVFYAHNPDARILLPIAKTCFSKILLHCVQDVIVEDLDDGGDVTWILRYRINGKGRK